MEITASSKNEVEFYIHGKVIPGKKENNLCLKAFHLLQSKYSIAPIRIDLLKQIPMGAGLGGGSSDAAHLLILCNNYFDLNLKTPELHALALELGSDVPFFLQNEARHVTGRGELIKHTILDVSGCHVTLVDTKIHSSTAEAFVNIDVGSGESLANKTLDVLKSAPEQFSNAFEPYLFGKHPILAQVKERLKEEDCFYASMTGSGSTIFGISDSKLNLSTSFINFCAEQEFSFQQTTFL